ncbi:H-NS histone family protein [Xinfangfangia pollutisoli]|uniref:H-NS histone family protein n=1 Tax=Xinfangfangia pollutisoli TaxID=2865960 RepID=UPI001CD3B44E|nr:H-NS histone family protein [Xinfangfangia pollutisoli]
MDIDLNTLSLKELKDLQAQVAKAISGFADRKKKEALAALEEKARDMGFSLAELTGVSAGRKRTVSAAKYRNPENPSETWTGRGRQPRWYAAAIKAGKSPEEMAA